MQRDLVRQPECSGGQAAGKARALPAVFELRRILGETLIRSKLNCADRLAIVLAFLHDLRWEADATPEDIRGLWGDFLKSGLPSNQFLELYLHFPFCKSRCIYCYTDSRVPSRQESLPDYCNELTEEARYFAPLFAGHRFRNLNVGGGTPSLLGADELEACLRPICDGFLFEGSGTRSIEFNPASTAPAKIKTIRGLGFNRVSFGVQTLNSKVLEAVHREYQDYDMVRRAVASARQEGLSTNVDLIFGLLGESTDSFLGNFRLLAGLGPTTIIITVLSLTDAYIRAMRVSRREYLCHIEKTLPEAAKGLARAARETGYRGVRFDPKGGEWIFLSPEIPEDRYRTWERRGPAGDSPNSTLSMGRYGRSRIFGRAVYRRDSRPFQPGSDCYRMAVSTLKEEMAQYILNNLENRSRVDYRHFQIRFGVDMRRPFSWELRALKALGKIRLDAEGFTFLPLRMPERILYGLFFLMDTLALSPFSRGQLEEGFRRRLQGELAEVALESPPGGPHG